MVSSPRKIYEEFLDKIASSGADIIGHNIEMPEALYSEVRPRSSYRRSLQALRTLKKGQGKTPLKSSFMLGLGEEERNVLDTLLDLKKTGVDVLYMGQYLSPSRNHWPVKKYYHPGEFRSLEEKARKIGFKVVLSGPMVRSSFRAHESYLLST